MALLHMVDFQAAAVANGNGVVQPCEVFTSALVEITISGTATVNFEFSGPITGSGIGVGAGWTALPGTNAATGASGVTSTTATGLFRFDIAALSHIRFRISGAAGATVSVRGLLSDMPLGPSSPGVASQVVDTELAAAAALTDATANPTVPGVASYGSVFNGTSWDRLRSNAAAVLAGTTQPFGQLVAWPGQWAITHAPAANTVATATKAAGGAGVRHVLNTVTATLGSAGAAGTAANLTLVVRDGASTAGTILWSITLGLIATAGNVGVVTVTGLNIVGSAATAMCVEFTAGPAANGIESVAATGYSTV